MSPIVCHRGLNCLFLKDKGYLIVTVSYSEEDNQKKCSSRINLSIILIEARHPGPSRPKTGLIGGNQQLGYTSPKMNFNPLMQPTRNNKLDWGPYRSKGFASTTLQKSRGSSRVSLAGIYCLYML